MWLCAEGRGGGDREVLEHCAGILLLGLLTSFSFVEVFSLQPVVDSEVGDGKISSNDEERYR